jgi:predicted small lipoprotein YifL
MSAAHATRALRGTALAALLAGALLTLGIAGGLSGCGLKGSLYLPQQKKAKVPATINNPAPDTPEETAPQPLSGGSSPQ